MDARKYLRKPSAQHRSSKRVPGNPRTLPALRPPKGSPSISHTPDSSQVAPHTARLYSPFPSRPHPALLFDEVSESSNDLHNSAATYQRPKPRPITRDNSTPSQDSKNAFNLRHRMRRPGGNIAPVTLSAPSADLLAVEEGRAFKDVGRAEIGDVDHVEMQDAWLRADKGVPESMRDMAVQQPTGFPPRYVYDYHPMHHPGRRYGRAAHYNATRVIPDHLPSFEHDRWEDGHADYEDQIQYMRGGGWYGPQDSNHRVQAPQDLYPPQRTHPNDAVPGYYYRARLHPQFCPSPVLCISPRPDHAPGAVPGPSQLPTYPVAQSTAFAQDRTTPEPEPSYGRTLDHESRVQTISAAQGSFEDGPLLIVAQNFSSRDNRSCGGEPALTIQDTQQPDYGTFLTSVGVTGVRSST
ncbi:hypothetical protein EDD15DRAFT_2206645 [Pisolithus albus]|nr:hypothetical protein EDD15DRAFT_2206645 [Pisolithus albus]